MSIFRYNYLDQNQLKRLDSYKYAAIDSSPISKYIMHPFWNWAVEFVPLSIAPNILTLTGFSCTIMNALLLTYYDYFFIASSDDSRSAANNPIPSIVWLICALNLFFAHTLDGIDGKQARRTKAMGPLGELMDHGVDSWTTVFVTMQVYSFFGSQDWSLGPHRMLYVFLSVFLSFYLTHWEKYNTGVLYLPWIYDMSQLFLFGCSLATFFYSYKIWKFTMPYLELPCSIFFEMILFSSVIFSLPMPLYNVYTSCKTGKNKYKSLADIIRPFISLSIFFIICVIWPALSPTDVLSRDPRMYFYVVGTVFSNISSRLIISQMSSSKCEIFNGCTIIFSIVAILSMSLPSSAHSELMLLTLLALVITIIHLHYAISVIHQLCDHFNINCLSLGKRNLDISAQKLLSNDPHNSKHKELMKWTMIIS